MKKSKKIGLALNKKVVSSLKSEKLVGGTGLSVNFTCTGMGGCTNDSHACRSQHCK